MLRSTGDARTAAVCLVAAGLMAPLGCGAREPAQDGSVSHYLKATKALEAGDQVTALSELDASLACRPSSWAYFERAQLLVQAGSDAEASADCQAGLKLDPTYGELKWLAEELKKPASQRFKGRYAKPPRAKK